jgi:hypothetical protein
MPWEITIKVETIEQWTGSKHESGFGRAGPDSGRGDVESRGARAVAGGFQGISWGPPALQPAAARSERGQPGEIQFTLYTTSVEPSETARFYAQAHGVPWKPGEQTISVKRAEGRKSLSVHPVSAPHPECGVKPDPEDRTVIVVSEKVP